MTESSGQDLGVEKRVVSLRRLFVPPFLVEGEEHWVVEIYRLTLFSNARPWVKGWGLQAGRSSRG